MADEQQTWLDVEETYHTAEQLEMERALLAAEQLPKCGYPAFRPADGSHPMDFLAELLARRLENEAVAHDFPHRPQEGSRRGPDRHAEPLAYGVMLCESSVLGSPYRCVLRTHVSLGELEHAVFHKLEPRRPRLLAETYGDLDLSWRRLWRHTVKCDPDAARAVADRMIAAGLLRLLEREMAEFVGGMDKGDGDWNWGPLTKTEQPFWATVDERFYPPAMLDAVRRMRAEAERLCVVSEVMET